MIQRPQEGGQLVHKAGRHLVVISSKQPASVAREAPDHSSQGLRDRGQEGGLPGCCVRTHGTARQNAGDQ